MAKLTVKDFDKSVRQMLDKHQKPEMVNPVDRLMLVAKKMRKPGMN